MTELQVLTPEIEGLLREIAADPDSCLLRLPQAEVREAAARGELPLLAGTTGLSIAERQLMRVYRREVAYLLRVACFQLASKRDANSDLRYFANSNGRRPDIHAYDGCKLQLPCSECWNGDPSLDDAVRLLERCVGADNPLGPSIYQLAAASLRLEPSATARNLAGLDLVLRRQTRAGRRVLHMNLQLDGETASLARMNAALAYEFDGELPLAYSLIVAALDYDGTVLQNCTTALSYAAQLGIHDEAMRRSRQLEESPDPNGEFQEIAIKLQRRRKLGVWTPKPGAHALLVSLSGDRAPRTRRVASAFA